MSSTSRSPHNDFLVAAQERRHQWEMTDAIWTAALSLLHPSGPPVININANNNNNNNNSHVTLRRLVPSEMETLTTTCGCRCKDWSQICLLSDASSLSGLPQQEDQSHYLRDCISNTNFEGVVILALPPSSSTTAIHDNSSTSSLDPWKRGPVGIHSNFLISNSIVSLQSWVSCNTLISDTHILPSSIVVGCGSMTGVNKNNNTLDQLTVTVGPESGGGRHLKLTPESDMVHVCQQLVNGSSSRTNVSDNGCAAASRVTANIISSNCVVRNTPSIQGIYLAPYSSIQAATCVSNVLLFPTATIQNSCIVENVRLQWNASISDNSRVSDTLLMEEAHIGPNSLVASSILGPDVHVSAGEVHNSVLGPNTNAHHQSLVISVVWPLGRGNVGYGANIGSNHTGRIPDQETTSGEGVFWGLSCVIKFPVDMTMAPYSIVAAGAALPPQRVCMPFSLIVTSDFSSGGNNILPGWVLSSSPYTIARSEKKYATRRKAMRHEHYTGWRIIRPDIISMCRWARKQLESVVTPDGEFAGSATIYATDKVIKGIGSNILNEKGRRSGIKAYTECIQKFALEGLLSWLMEQNQMGRTNEGILRKEFDLAVQISCNEVEKVSMTYENVAWPTLPWAEETESLWSFQKALLLEEFPCKGDFLEWLCELLQALVILEKAYAIRIFKSKKRDDQRGANTVPGYEDCHLAADTDPVIKEAKRRADEVETNANHLIGKLKRSYLSKL